MWKLWSTDEVASRDRLPYWVDAVCETYVQLDCDVPRQDAPFSGAIAVGQLATLGLSRVTASPQTVRRTPAKIARETEDYFLVSLQTNGRGTVVQDGRTADLSPGDFALYDSTRPYRLVFDDAFQQYVLRLPGAVLRSRMRAVEDLTARKVCGDSGAGRLLTDLINAVATRVDTLEAGSVAAIAEGIEDFLVAGLCSLPGAAAPVDRGSVSCHRSRIKAYVARRLRDPDLCIAAIAAHLHLSPSTIFRAFADEPASISAWIWAQRLDGAKRDLCDPVLATLSITDVAFGWGFNDTAHFSRMFRRRFGCSARELRAEQAGISRGRRSGGDATVEPSDERMNALFGHAPCRR